MSEDGSWHYGREAANRAGETRAGPEAVNHDPEPVTDGGKSLGEMNLEEIEDRLDELQERKEEARELRQSIDDVLEGMEEIAGHHLVGEELDTKIRFLKMMFAWATHHDLHAEKAVRYEREQLRRRKFELEHQEETDDGELVTDGGTHEHTAIPSSKSLEAAEMCLREAREQLDDGDVFKAIKEIGSAATFAAEAGEFAPDETIASIRIGRAGDHQDTWTDLTPGDTKEIEINGKATVRVQAETDPNPTPDAGGEDA